MVLIFRGIVPSRVKEYCFLISTNTLLQRCLFWSTVDKPTHLHFWNCVGLRAGSQLIIRTGVGQETMLSSHESQRVPKYLQGFASYATSFKCCCLYFDRGHAELMISNQHYAQQNCMLQFYLQTYAFLSCFSEQGFNCVALKLLRICFQSLQTKHCPQDIICS